jgi:hypothetical protein
MNNFIFHLDKKKWETTFVIDILDEFKEKNKSESSFHIISDISIGKKINSKILLAIDNFRSISKLESDRKQLFEIGAGFQSQES